MDWFPDEPEVSAAERATGEAALRYEDIAQDGRLMLLALPQSIGDVIWRKLLLHHPAAHDPNHGIIPILTRFVLEGGGGPASVARPVSVAGRYQFAHTVGSDGAVDRILLNMWTTLTAPAARTNGPPPPNAGEPQAVGRVFAEHVLTRLFAPPSERKVLRVDAPGLEPVPRARWTWRAPSEVLLPPDGAAWLDEDFREDAAPIVFGLNHTDSNQHVNSLVYPRLFQEAALRRLAAHGRPVTVLARRLEIAYRKPMFAGERAKILLRAFTVGAEAGAVGVFVSEGASVERPHCTMQIRFG